jgi:hypothetical protein
MKAALIYNKWDIVILQQVSGYSGMYETWQPYLNNLVASIKADCLNPKVAIGWQMTWAYADNLTNIPQYSNSQSVMYQSIVNAVQKMQKEVNIAVVIPSGTAIQNLRQTSLNNPPLDITRDNSHIDLGAGRYTLACTWFEALIAPYFDISMQDNNVRTSEGNIPVNTDANAKLCQYAARYACEYPYQISVIQPTGALRQHVKTNL